MSANAFQSAISLHREGKLRDAERLYEAVLQTEPDHAEALHYLGVLCAQCGKIEDGIRLLQRSLARDPEAAGTLNDLGVALEKAARYEEALAPYERALALKPDYAEAHYNLGTVLQILGRHDQAICRFEGVITLRPGHADAHNNLGNSLHAVGRHEEAIPHLEQALALRTKFPEAHNNLGAALQALGRHDEAIARFERALGLRSSFAEAHYNLGNSLYHLDRFEEAARHYEQAISIQPNYARAHNNLGNSLSALGRQEVAITQFEEALRLDPTYAQAHYNLGNTLRLLNRHRESLSRYDQALALDPELAEGHWNQAWAHLALGEYELGWKKYEWRWRVQTRRRPFQQPLWLGEEKLAGKTILLHAEQGLGDTLQFCRYAPLVRDRGARVLLEVQPEHFELLRDSLAGPSLTVLARDEHDLPGFDLHCPLMSLPLAFGTVLETVPALVPYLRADAQRSTRWAARLESTAPFGPRVGLIWAGNPHKDQTAELQRLDARRSVSLAAYRPLLDVDGVAFISLQKGEAASQVSDSGLAILDPTGELHSFADTAALVANLDLVLTVDTSVAHLAGGLGKPTWMLSRFDGCWRWLLDRENSPWYPTMRIFRQPAPGAWAPIIERLATDLRRFAQGDESILRPAR
jgi:tetratricopeptide (TPR) repeat protein